MKNLWRVACPLVFTGVVISAVFAQRAFREYPSVEYGGGITLPSDWGTPAEWTFARLMFPPGPLDGYRGHLTDPGKGASLWTQDYPRADPCTCECNPTPYARRCSIRRAARKPRRR